MKLQDLTIRDYVEKTASGEAMPAGGSAIALCAALAISLTEMVAKLTIGKKKYESFEKRIMEIAVILETNRNLLLDYMEQDAESYQKVLNAYELPKDSEEDNTIRNNKIDEELKSATVVQLNVALKSYKLLDVISEIKDIVDGSLSADNEVSLMICCTAIRGALLNVRANLSLINDKSYINDMQDMCNSIEKDLEDNYGLKC